MSKEDVSKYVEFALTNHDRFVRKHQGISFFGSMTHNMVRFLTKEIPPVGLTILQDTIYSTVQASKEVRTVLSDAFNEISWKDLSPKD